MSVHEFEVPDMSCGHCAATINRALHELAPQARVEIRLSEKRVQVEATDDTTPEVVLACLQEAGYAARQV